MTELHARHVDAMTSRELYALLRLRTDVFGVEQACAYPELDGRDLEPGALMVWASDGGDVVACARMLPEVGAVRVGRVAVRPDRRGSGLGGQLVERVLALCAEIAPGEPVVLDAQSYLEGWYARWGFGRDGDPFVEDGIPHVPMRRT